MERILRVAANRAGEVWLNVGSGAYPVPGFINLDNHPYLLAAPLYPLLRGLFRGRRGKGVAAYYEATKAGVFARYDCRKPLRFATPMVNHVLCSHFLEHVYPDEAVQIVQGFAHALKPGGTVHIIVPDLEVLARHYVAKPDDPTAADRFLDETVLSSPHSPSWRYRVMELLGFEGLQHRWMYDRRSLTRLVEAAGLVVLARNETPSAHVRADEAESLHVVAMKPR